MHAGDRGAHGPHEVRVEGDGQLRVDPALHAHLGGAGLRRLDRPRGDLVEREPVGVGVALALRERAEPAAHVADVREVDVAVDDVGDLVADDVAAQVVGGLRQLLQRGALGEDQRHRGVRVRRVEQRGGIATTPARARRGRRRPAVRAPACRVAVELARAARPSRRRPTRSRRGGRRCGPWCRCVSLQVDPAGGGEPAVRLLPRPARPARRPRGARPVSGRPAPRRARAAGRRSTASPRSTYRGYAVSRSRSVNPASADRAASSSMAGQGRSGLTWSAVTGETPPQSSMPGAEHERELVADEVRRRLQPHLRPEHEPGDGDRGGEVVEVGVRVVRHRGVRLRPEVLDDRLLDVPVRPRRGPDREQRLGPLDARLPDADEDAGGERARRRARRR